MTRSVVVDDGMRSGSWVTFSWQRLGSERAERACDVEI